MAAPRYEGSWWAIRRANTAPSVAHLVLLVLGPELLTICGRAGPTSCLRPLVPGDEPCANCADVLLKLRPKDETLP